MRSSRLEVLYSWTGVLGNLLIAGLYYVICTVGIRFFASEAGEIEAWDAFGLITTTFGPAAGHDLHAGCLGSAMGTLIRLSVQTACTEPGQVSGIGSVLESVHGHRSRLVHSPTQPSLGTVRGGRAPPTYLALHAQASAIRREPHAYRFQPIRG